MTEEANTSTGAPPPMIRTLLKSRAVDCIAVCQGGGDDPSLWASNPSLDLDDGGVGGAVLASILTNDWQAGSQLRFLDPDDVREQIALADEEVELPTVATTQTGPTQAKKQYCKNYSITRIDGYHRRVFALAHVPRFPHVVAGCSNGEILLQKWQPLLEGGVAEDYDDRFLPSATRFLGHEAMIGSVSVSGNAGTLVSGSHDQTVRLWDLDAVRCLHTFRGHVDNIHSVCMSSDGNLVLSASHDMTVKMWSTRSGRCEREFVNHYDSVRSVSLAPDGVTAVSAGGHDVKVWDCGTLSEIASFAHPAGVTSCFSFGQDTIVTGCFDGHVRLFHMGTSECVQQFKAFNGVVSQVALMPDGVHVIASSNDSQKIRVARPRAPGTGSLVKAAGRY